jgi:hypothetical protein
LLGTQVKNDKLSISLMASVSATHDNGLMLRHHGLQLVDATFLAHGHVVVTKQEATSQIKGSLVG